MPPTVAVTSAAAIHTMSHAPRKCGIEESPAAVNPNAPATAAVEPGTATEPAASIEARMYRSVAAACESMGTVDGVFIRGLREVVTTQSYALGS